MFFGKGSFGHPSPISACNHPKKGNTSIKDYALRSIEDAIVVVIFYLVGKFVFIDDYHVGLIAFIPIDNLFGNY